MYNNYKGLPYKDSIKQFTKDYRIKYILYGRNTYYKTKKQKIRVKNLNRQYLKNIVERCGNTYIRNNYPFVWYRYIKEVMSK